MKELRSQSKKKRERNINSKGMKFVLSLSQVSHGEVAILPKEKESEQGKRLASFFIQRGATSWSRKRTGS
jgi:hypothetical protein